MASECPSSVCGVWKQDGRSESLCPLLTGLGMPLLPIACRVADATTTTLRITCPRGEGSSEFEIVDKTAFGRNSTHVSLGGPEVEKATRGGRKKFMLSGHTVAVSGDQPETSVINCRLYQRGEGWSTRQERFVDPKDPGTLVERNILTRPGEPDLVVKRFFTKQEDKSRELGVDGRGGSPGS